MQQASDVQRHPWNTTFEWVDHQGPFQQLTDEQVRRYDEQGFVVVEDLIEPALLAEVRAQADQSDERAEAFLRDQEDGRLSIAEAGAITFNVHLVRQSDVMRQLSCHPRLTGICADLVGPDVNLYWDQAVYKKPEKPRRFPWHQDNGYAYVEPQQYLTIWLALTDATIENGCPQVVPGLHRLGTIAHHYVDPLGWECLEDPPGAVAAPVKAGGAVVFSSLTPHLTGPNTTDSVRKAYILQYAPAGALRLEGNPAEGAPSKQVPCDDPERQYPVVIGGQLVA